MSKASGLIALTWLKGFFSFRIMVTSMMLQVIYILGAVGVVMSGLLCFAVGASAMWVATQDHAGWDSPEYLAAVAIAISGLATIVVGTLVWRVFCEGLIVMFRISDTLTSIDNKTTPAPS